MSASLALFLIGVFADEGNLSVLVFKVGPEVDEVKIVGHKENRVALVIFIKCVPDFLGEETEPGCVRMFVRADVGQSSQGYFDILGLADLLCSIRMNFGQNNASKQV